MRRLQAVLYYCGCFMYFCPMIENLCKNTAFAQKTTWHKRGGGLFAKRPGEKPENPRGGDAQAVPAPVPVQGAEKVERAHKKRAYAMHRLFNANACRRRHMMQEKPWHWRVRRHHGQGGGRAQWRERQGGRGNNANTGRCGENCRACGLFCAPCGGWFPYLAKNGGAAARTACVGSTVQGAAARGSRPFCKKAWRKTRKSCVMEGQEL